MDTIEIKTVFDKADHYLEAARIELNRPAEDVVPYMVCRNARNSVAGYLQAFLLVNGVKQDDEIAPETLLSRCRAINSKFRDLDLSALKFANDDEYSAEYDEMESCINLARRAKQLVTE